MTDETQGPPVNPEPVQEPETATSAPVPPADPVPQPDATAPVEPAPVDPPKDQYRAQPIRVDGRNRQHEAAGLEGGFVRVKNGEHKGLVGVFYKALEHGRDGFPTRILFRSRDADNQDLDVAYEDVEATPGYVGGR